MVKVTSKSRRTQSDNQLERFKDMAREVGADEAPGALERAFGKLDPKKREKPAKSK
ncbi:MAG: hypothetical protein CMLOHMNK_00272 [Steroidobacteraceae bacterium]|nr:hypothetical protein [Steroidobacteraceae bacterium]